MSQLRHVLTIFISATLTAISTILNLVDSSPVSTLTTIVLGSVGGGLALGLFIRRISGPQTPPSPTRSATAHSDLGVIDPTRFNSPSFPIEYPTDHALMDLSDIRPDHTTHEFSSHEDTIDKTLLGREPD